MGIKQDLKDIAEKYGTEVAILVTVEKKESSKILRICSNGTNEQMRQELKKIISFAINKTVEKAKQEDNHAD